jgi:putative membrane protein
MRQHITGAIVLLSAVFASATAHAWHPGVRWPYYLFGPLMWIVCIGVVVVLMVLALRWLGSSGYLAFIPPVNMPLNILQERFARGEIDAEEFEERRRLLAE